MNDELPEGWTAARLDLLLTNGLFTDGDWVESKDQDPAGDVRLVQLADVGDGVYRDRSARFLTTQKARELGCTFLKQGDVLVARMPDPLGRACIFPGDPKPSVTVVDVCVVRPSVSSPVTAPYLLHTINAPQTRSMIAEHERGTTRKRISRTNLGSLVLPVPPLPEQGRIVARVEALLADVRKARERLDRVRLILKRFRQAVLVAACSGELTREWRDARASAPTGRDLLGAIASRRKDLGLATATRPIDDADMPDTELPETWTWCRVGEVADVRLGGTPSRNEPNYWNGTIPWISSGEVANCRIRDTEEKITREGLANCNAKLYPPGTVLIAMIGEGKTRGQAALLEIESSTNQNAAGLVFDVGMMNPEYVWLWALGEYEKNRNVGRGGNQPALNGAKVRALPLPLPPLDEQGQVVQAVKRIVSLIDAIESHVRTAASRADRLPQTILTRALAGDLVPTEAELARVEGRAYETAAALLKRVEQPKEVGARSRLPNE